MSSRCLALLSVFLACHHIAMKSSTAHLGTPHPPRKENISFPTADTPIWVKASVHQPYFVSCQLQLELLFPTTIKNCEVFNARRSVDTGFVEKPWRWRPTQWLNFRKHNFSSSWMPLTAVFILRTFEKRWKNRFFVWSAM